MKHALVLTAALALAPMLPQGAAAQDIMMATSQKGVDATVDQLVSAVEGAGAKVFAVVDHGAGAQMVDSDIGASKLVIFGNPKIGTPALVDDRRAGLFLPLRVLVYEDEAGGVIVAYEDPAGLARLDGISEEAAYLATMRGALKKLTGAAME